MPETTLFAVVLVGFILLFTFGSVLAQRRSFRTLLSGISEVAGHAPIAVGQTPRSGGFIAVYDGFVLLRENALGEIKRVTYDSVTRLGVVRHRFSFPPQATVCVESRGTDGTNHMAMLVCTHPDQVIPALQANIGGAAGLK